MRTIVWFLGKDLRVGDHEPLARAAAEGEVVPLFVFEPWFRVFNPVLQGDRFDPSGGYVRRWLPRLDRLPNRYIHRPWEAPARVLEAAGIRLGQDYPYPVVDHSRARDRFLKVARNYLRGRVEDAGG